jgi:hypothetical protein
MNIKSGPNGASLAGIKPEAVVGMLVVMSLFAEINQPFRLTSGLEGAHSLNSLHFLGLAFDISTSGIVKEAHHDITRRLIDNLGDEFDVIYEHSHWHIEFQVEHRKP